MHLQSKWTSLWLFKNGKCSVCCFAIKGPAYGSTREVLKGSLKEADKLSESHVIIKDRLLNIVSASVMDWKAENYKKQLIGCKPAKTFEEEFQRVRSH